MIGMPFVTDESGSATIGGLYFSVAALMLAGLAVDQANGWAAQTRLQVATDAAALAAAMDLPDLDAARAMAITVATENLGRAGIVTAGDVIFGIWDEAQGSFVPTEEAALANAVQVRADLSAAGGDALPTYLLRLVGLNSWNIAAATTATNSAARGADPGPTATRAVNCNMMTVISYGSIQTGGGNDLAKGVCIHGQVGVATGGGDHYDRDVTFSAPALDDIFIASYLPNNISFEELTLRRSLEPTILPLIDDLMIDLWTALYAAAPASYEGALLPDFLFETGPADVVIKEGWWAIQPGELSPGTIYVVNGSAQFAGDVYAEDVAFIVNGDLGTGGGWQLHFEDVFFIGRNLNLAGNVTWGEHGTQCKKDYFSVYLLGTESLSMGGWGNAVSVNGVVGAAPLWSPGGNMKARNVYFETGRPGYMTGTSLGGDIETSLGGDLSINGNDCSFELRTHFPMATRADQALGVEGNKLARLIQ